MPQTNATRRFTYIEARATSSGKSHQWSRGHRSLRRIGTGGQTNTKSFADAAAAQSTRPSDPREDVQGYVEGPIGRSFNNRHRRFRRPHIATGALSLNRGDGSRFSYSRRLQPITRGPPAPVAVNGCMTQRSAMPADLVMRRSHHSFCTRACRTEWGDRDVGALARG